jgi:hypothetical protein
METLSRTGAVVELDDRVLTHLQILTSTTRRAADGRRPIRGGMGSTAVEPRPTPGSQTIRSMP